MAYPIIAEAVGKAWFRDWQEACEEAGARVAPLPPSTVEVREVGEEVDWEGISNSLVEQLLAIKKDNSEGYFESEGSILVHKLLPDHEALRDPEFWYWLAIVPGASLVSERYPFKAPDGDAEVGQKGAQNYLPGRNNFVGSNARETLFFRFWIRTEMALSKLNEEEDKFEFVRPGLIDFWRSHVFRQLYAHHRPFVQAFVDFQFPKPTRDKPTLSTPEIRQLASDLSKSCANVTVEMLSRIECMNLIERQWTKTKARIASAKTSEEKMAAE